MRQRLPVVLAAMVGLALLGWVTWREVIDIPRLPEFGAPASSTAEIDTRLRAYRTDDRYIAVPLVRPEKWPLECQPANYCLPEYPEDKRYLYCKRYVDNGTPEGLPALIAPAEGVPAYHGNVRVRAGWPPVRVRVWVVPDAATARGLVDRAAGTARSCRGHHSSDIALAGGMLDAHSVAVAPYARGGWSGSEVRVDGRTGDDSTVSAGGGDPYLFRTVVAARGKLVAELRWGAGEPRFYQFVSDWVRRGGGSVDAVLAAIGGTRRP